MKKKVFLTGATGVMGMAGLEAVMASSSYPSDIELTVLARPGKVNSDKLAPYMAKGVKVIWGDLLNPEDVARGVDGADMVLHVGGMVSPAADWYPEKTMKVNVGSMDNIIRAAKKKEGRGERVDVVYIGSVSQYGPRKAPMHWGRCGDPVKIATFDKYALSKSLAERNLAESGLKHWVSLRQTGIMYPGILMKASDPISFHVPMQGCLEWVSDRDSGRLMASLCEKELPESFYRKFYNIGGGEKFRLRNYDFMAATLKALGCPPPEKVFDLNWFATGNFHGIWYLDSDALDSILKFRSGGSFFDYINEMKNQLPFYFKLAPLAPAFLIKWVMGKVAEKKVLGPMNWIKTDNRDRVIAAWGSMKEYESIPDWKDAQLPPLSQEKILLDHGYDESKPMEEIDIEDIRKAAEFRGGELLSEEMKKGDIDTPLSFRCGEGHEFQLTPRTMFLGGHWCEDCLRRISDDPLAAGEQARKNRFLAQTL